MDDKHREVLYQRGKAAAVSDRRGLNDLMAAGDMEIEVEDVADKAECDSSRRSDQPDGAYPRVVAANATLLTTSTISAASGNIFDDSTPLSTGQPEGSATNCSVLTDEDERHGRIVRINRENIRMSKCLCCSR